MGLLLPLDDNGLFAAVLLCGGGLLFAVPVAVFASVMKETHYLESCLHFTFRHIPGGEGDSQRTFLPQNINDMSIVLHDGKKK